MPHLPKFMVRRKGRKGYWFVRRFAGRRMTRFLGSDYEAALRKLRSFTGAEPPKLEITIAEAAKRWLATYVETARNPKGRKQTATRVKKYLVPAMGHYLLPRITSDHVRAYKLHLESKDLSVQSVSHMLSDARCLFGWCAETGLVDRSPFPKRIMPRIQERPPDRLTDEQADQLAALPEPYGFVCRLALGTGLRWGELTRADASHLERGFLVVSQTKSSKIRRVPLDPELHAEIRTHIGRLVPRAELSPGSFSRSIRKITGITGFHAHQMRHTFACQWLERGGSLAALQQILGHASIVTTQRYARLTDEIVMAERLRMGRRDDQEPTKAARSTT